MTHHGAGLRRLVRDDAKVAAIESDYRNAAISIRERAILDYAVKLTVSPAEMQATDIDSLRDVGLSDDEILDVCQVASYYNFVNRMAQGLGVELEEHWAAGRAKDAGT